MPEKSNLFNKIREVVKSIPKGKVATYGQIGLLAGTRDARRVGWALRGNEDPEIPCHRVVKADGSLATNYTEPDGQSWQKTMLKKEGVQFSTANKIDLPIYQWDGV